jgi:hypothetical protein
MPIEDDERRPRSFADMEEEEEKPQEPKKPEKPKREFRIEWAPWMNVAGSIVGLTAIFLLTLEVATDTLTVGRIVAYAMGAILMIGLVLILVVAYKFLLPRIKEPLWRYVALAFTIPLAFIYYIAFSFLVFGQFTPMLIKLMERVSEQAP